MTKIKFHHVMKALSLLLVFLYFYPILTIFVLYFRHGDGSVWIEQLQFILWGYCGSISGWLLAAVEKKRGQGLSKFESGLVTLLIGILPVGGSILFHLSFEKAYIVWMAIFALGIYLFANRLYFTPYGKLASVTNYILGIVGAFICIFMMWVFEDHVLKSVQMSFSYAPLLYLFLLWTGLFAALRNQANIDLMMSRRKHNLEDLPKKIRYYNLLLIIAVFAVVVIFFCLRGWIVSGIYWFGARIKDLIVLIGWGIYYVFMFFKGDEMELEGDQQTGSLEIGIGGGKQGIDDGFIPVILIIALLGVIINYRRQIFGWIMEQLRRLGKWILKLFKRGSLMDGFEDYNEYYQDEVEDVRDEEVIIRAKGEHTLKEWKRLRKKYLKMENSVEKLQIGYGLLATWLSIKGVPVRPSDTPLEILKKGEFFLKNLPGLSMTEQYHLVKYRDDDPKEETFTALTQIILKIGSM